ncbi:MAG: DNA polymerase II [Granulosicoccus sp.]|nr:DNA polymerase II [Granulosicoccus sp.]
MADVNSTLNQEHTGVVRGYLLSRQWRDMANGIELSYWASSEIGPIRLTIPGQEAVCFIERHEPLMLPPDCRRQPVDLELLHGSAVDALYFRKQRLLNEFRQLDSRLNESDIKPADRYLMERFVTASFSATGSVVQRDGYLEMPTPKLSPDTYLPALKLLSLDIETQGLSDRLYSIGGHFSGSDTDDSRVFMLGTGETEPREGYTLSFHNNEKQLLSDFFSWLRVIDPDVIIGWSVVNFDLNFLERKCRSLGVPFAFGRGSDASTILQPGNDNQPRIARIPGRPVLDGIDLLKAAFWNFESFSLENVAQQMLGTGKLIQSDEDKLAEINRLFREDKATLADYNFKDCQLVTRIFDKADLLAFAIQRARMTGLPMDRMGGSVAAFDFLYLPRLHRKGVVAPDITRSSDGLGSPGGYVLDSEPGLYNNVLVLDFKSLYPSIIRTFCIDPLGMFKPGENPVDGFLEASFSRDEHILPELISSLWQERDLAKENHNAPLSQAIKIIMNSFYGVLGSSGCRFHHQKLASSITRRGHEIITRTRDFIEEQGYRVIYGDTDSVFVWLGDDVDESAANTIGEALMTSLNHWWTENLQREHQLPCHLEVEYETHYLRFLMPTVRGMPTGSKKRYAGLIRKGDELEMVFKGLEAVRTDWTPLARTFQRELFRRVFFEEPFDDYVRETVEQLNAGQLDEQLIYRKRLRRKLTDYQRNVPPHVQAARKQKKSGHWVSYVITRAGPEPIDNQQSAPDYQHYLEKQLAPAADGILHFLDTSFGAITDAQMQMF